MCESVGLVYRFVRRMSWLFLQTNVSKKLVLVVEFSCVNLKVG